MPRRRARARGEAKCTRSGERGEGELLDSAIFAAIYFATAAIYSAVSAAERRQSPRRDCSSSTMGGRRGIQQIINNQRDSAGAPFFGN